MVTITLEQNGLVRTLSGVVSMDEMDASAQSIQNHPQIDEMKYNIHDFTALTEANLTDMDIDFMAARANVSVLRNPRLKLVFVGNHPIVHKLVTAFNAVGYSQNIVVRFDTLGEAQAYVSS